MFLSYFYKLRRGIVGSRFLLYNCPSSRGLLDWMLCTGVALYANVRMYKIDKELV